MDNKKPKIEINDYYDGFDIVIDGERFSFDQEDTREKLVDVFNKLGYYPTYEEVY